MTCCLSVRGRGVVTAPPRAAMRAPRSTPTTKAAAVARCTTILVVSRALLERVWEKRNAALVNFLLRVLGRYAAAGRSP